MTTPIDEPNVETEEPTICYRCKHCTRNILTDYHCAMQHSALYADLANGRLPTTSLPPTLDGYNCCLHILQPGTVDYVTGDRVSPVYQPCSEINTEGKCPDFEAAKVPPAPEDKKSLCTTASGSCSEVAMPFYLRWFTGRQSQ